MKAWIHAGKTEISRHGTMDGTTDIMGVDLRVPVENSFEDLMIFNVYAPSTHGNEIEIVENFWTELLTVVLSLHLLGICSVNGL
jgi:hypothetical protein